MDTSEATDAPVLIDLIRQRARLYGGGVAIGLAFILILAVPFLLSHDFVVAALASIGAEALALFGSALYLIRTLRCPMCHLPLLQYVFAEIAYGRWLSWLLAIKDCPKCGYPAKL